MKKIRTWFRSHWILLIVAVSLIGGGFYYFAQKNTSDIPVIRVQTQTVIKGNLSVAVSGSGQIQADAQVDLKPVVAGDALEVMSVVVQNDQEVIKGQVIAVLDNEDARRNVERSKLDLRRAEIQLKQKEDLYPKETKDDKYERQLSEASVTESRIALVEAQERLNDYTIRAPFDGIVTGLVVDSGDTISQTGILASVITKNMKAVITLNEVDAAKVKVGNIVTLTFDALPNEQAQGKVTKLDTIGTAEQGVVSYGAEIALDEQNSNLKPGMSVSAEITVVQKENILLIPNAAITYEDNKAYVEVATNRLERVGQGQVPSSLRIPEERGQRKEIAIGLTDNVNTEVVTGLSEGERILIRSAAAPASVSQSATQRPGGAFNFLSGPRAGSAGSR